MGNRPDGFIQNMTSRVVAKMACWSPPGELMAGSDLQYYLTWLKDQLRMQGNEYVQSVARGLQMMLRLDDYRQAFVGVGGIATLVSVLSGRVNFQIQYQLTFCLWVLSFNVEVATKLNKFGESFWQSSETLLRSQKNWRLRKRIVSPWFNAKFSNSLSYWSRESLMMKTSRKILII